MINKKQLEEDLSEAVVAELTKKGLKMDTKTLTVFLPTRSK